MLRRNRSCDAVLFCLIACARYERGGGGGKGIKKKSQKKEKKGST